MNLAYPYSFSTLGRTAPVTLGDGINAEECIAYLLVASVQP